LLKSALQRKLLQPGKKPVIRMGGYTDLRHTSKKLVKSI
jgi:hypothetical protein